MLRLMKKNRRSQILRDPTGQDSRDHNSLRSHSVSTGEAALKRLGESPSRAEAEKTEDQPSLNRDPLRGTVLFYEDPFEPAVSEAILQTVFSACNHRMARISILWHHFIQVWQKANLNKMV